MSDAQNLNDFFAQNSKKKKPAKKPAAKAKKSAAADEETHIEEVKTETAPAVQPEAQQPSNNAFADQFEDSDDDESNQIVLNEGRQKVIDRKDVEASQKNKEDDSSDAVAGWGLGSLLGKPAESSANQVSFASSAKPQTGGNMSFGKPTFQRKSKGIMGDTQDFPDIGDASIAATGNGPADVGGSKANRPMMFSGGAAARGPRVEGETQGFSQGGFGGFGQTGSEEIKTAATKPVFRGKAKFNTGKATEEEANTTPSMNYDFSKMRMSAATSKVAGAPGEEGENRAAGADGERRGGPRGVHRGADGPMFGDEDFEVVAEKVKKPFVPREGRREFEEPTFGGGKPMFTRGNADRK